MHYLWTDVGTSPEACSKSTDKRVSPGRAALEFPRASNRFRSGEPLYAQAPARSPTHSPRPRARQYRLPGERAARCRAREASRRFRRRRPPPRAPTPQAPKRTVRVALWAIRSVPVSEQHDHHPSGHVQVRPKVIRIHKRAGGGSDRTFRATRETGATNGGTGRIEATACVEMNSEDRLDGSSRERAGSGIRPVAQVGLQCWRRGRWRLCRGLVEDPPECRAPGLRASQSRRTDPARTPVGRTAPARRALLTGGPVRESVTWTGPVTSGRGRCPRRRARSCGC